jgi:hypothetical protein
MPRRNSLLLFAGLIFVCFQILGCGCNGSPKIKISGSFPATGTVNSAYGPATITASGGKGTLTWGTPAGLPPGVVVEQPPGPGQLTIGGTPTTAGSYNVSATVTDSKGHSATYMVTIVIAPAPGVTISGTLPATGTVGTAYTGSLTASGGATPYSWTVTGLPTGVTPSGTTTATVTAAGTPTAAGTFSVTATVTDANSKTATYTVSVVISPAPPLAISGTLAATGTVNTAYSGSLMATGGTSPYSWTITGLPTGLMYTGASTATVSISGKPTTAARYPVVATVTDSKAATATYNVTIVISAATGATLTISPTALGTLTQSTAVTPIVLTETPATTQPYKWTVTVGSLPTGLVLSNGTTTSATTITSTTNSVSITGTPTASGAYSFTLSVKDSASPQGSGSQAYSGTVNAASTATACGPPASGTLPLRGNESALTTPWAFVLAGDDINDAPADWAGSFTPNGSGGITAADIDFIGSTAGPESLQVQLAGSSYSYGSDGRGCLYLAFSGENGAVRPSSAKRQSSSIRHGKGRRHMNARPAVLANVGTVTFSFVISSLAQAGGIEQFDYVNSEIAAAGQMHAQTASDFSVSKLASQFAFGADGWVTVDTDGDIDRAAIAGSVTNAAGTLSNSVADDNIGGSASGELTGGSGSLKLSTVSTTTGRGTGSYTIPNGETPFTFGFVYYIVNGSDFFMISNDDPSTVGNFVLAGRALASAASSTPLNGYYLTALNGFDFNFGDNGGNYVAVSTLQATSGGSVPASTVYANDAGAYSATSFSGSYTLDTTSGRLAFSGGTDTFPVGYLTATASDNEIVAFLVSTDGFSSSGVMLTQGTSAPDFGVGNLSNGYAFGSSEDVTGVNGTLDGQFDFTGTGSYTYTIDIVNVGEVASQPNQTGSGSVAVNTDGSGNFDSDTENFVTNGDVILAIDNMNSDSTNGQPLLYIFIKQ